MADPVSLGVTMGLTALGGVVGAMGSAYKGQAESQMYQYQAGVADMNRRVALQNADWEFYSGQVERQEAGLQARYQIGQTRTIQAASGLDIARGSPAAVVAGEQKIAAYNQYIIGENAAKRVYGEQLKAVQEDTQRNIDMMGADQARTSGYIGAVTSILGAASSVSSQWTKGKQLGMYSGGYSNATGTV